MKRIKCGMSGPLLVMILAMAYSPCDIAAQFEQKMSVNLSGGYFNTIGWRSHEFEDSDGSWSDPTLMPNFKGGPAAIGGIQYNFSSHFSLEIQIGYSFAPGWYYDDSGGDDEPYNYLSYEIYEDTIDWNVVASGEDYMDMTNIHFGIVPRYYFLPEGKFNPFVYAGVTFNLTDVYFEDNEYEAYLKLDRLDEWDGDSDVANWFESHSGVGFMGGAGVEYSINEHLALVGLASYHFIPLKSSAFIWEEKYSNYHDISIQVGIRMSFLKSKRL